MDINTLAEILKTMYENAPEDSKLLNIYLFGIGYGEKIIAGRYSISEILKKARLDSSYKDNLMMGVRLSQHAEIVPK